MEPKKFELMRSSHFHIGSYKNDFATSYKEHYMSSPVSLESPMRNGDREKTHFVLGSDFKSLQTESRSQFIPYNYDTDRDRSPEAIKAELTSSHFRFGDNPSSYMTTNKDDYQSHKLQSHSLDLNIKNQMKNSSVPFNDSPKDMISTSRASFVPRSIEFANNFKLSRKLITDFKKEHFQLGFHKRNTSSTMKDSFSPHFHHKPDKLVPRSNHHSVVLGYDKSRIKRWDNQEKMHQIRRRAFKNIMKF